MKKYSFLLLTTIFLAFFLRFWQLGQNPPSLTWDEAAWGYNAYSLGIDGRDEFGKFLPIQYLESFGDFKPPVYAYLTILPVKIFGLNEFSTRFASALFGVLTVVVTYFLVKKLFGKCHSERSEESQWDSSALPQNDTLAFLSSFLLAISPWHINLSRAAFEANIASFFIVTGVWLWLVAVKQGDSGRAPLARMTVICLTLSVISFILSMYTFNTARIVAPLLVLGLSFGFRKELVENKKETIIACLAGLVIIIPLAQFLITPQAKLRFNEVNIFSDIGIIEKTNQEIKNDKNAWWSKVIHNRRFAYGQEFLKHYFDHFNPAFLFIKGDGNPKFSTQDIGQLYLWEAPFLIAGIFFLIKKRPAFWWFIFYWLLIGIIPAATARETPHALRIETTLPVWQIITAYGFYQFREWLKNRHSGPSAVSSGQSNCLSRIRFWSRFAPQNDALIIIFSLSLLIFNSVYYLHGYYTHYPKEFSGEWQYGYKEAINYIRNVENKYDKVIFTESLGRPYIYFLFYNKVSPSEFRQTAKIWREAYGFVHVDGFGKYEFVKTIKPEDFNNKTLFVDLPNNVPDGARTIKTFNLLNGNPALTAYTR